MPLSGASPTYLHILQNISLILLAALFTPICTFIAVASRIISPYTRISKHIKSQRKWRKTSSSTFRPRKILVTGVGMSKGLTLARAFYRAGHRVIGADFEPYMIPVCGHFSTSIERFYRLSKPSSKTGAANYIKDLKDIAKKEKVEIWVSCSGVASAVEDGEAADVIEKETECKAIQFGAILTGILHEKDSFIKNTRKLGLNVPETHLVTSEAEALEVLYPEKTPEKTQIQYIMKTVGLDDSVRADMTLLPRSTRQETETHLKRLNPTTFRPFVLQQYISGPEYCTYSLIIKGQVKSFVACPSADLLMHYLPLPSSSALSQAMYLYTKIYAEKMGPGMTGHFSIDFLVNERIAQQAESQIGASEREIKFLLDKIYPIECNPRTHTAVVSFADVSEDLSEAYLSIIPDHEPKGIYNGHRAERLVVPGPDVSVYYWIGHDLVTKVCLPILAFLRSEIDYKTMIASGMDFWELIVYGRDGTFEIWDPWPAWWLYVGYWPLKFWVSIWEGGWWSRCNASTTKMFAC